MYYLSRDISQFIRLSTVSVKPIRLSLYSESRRGSMALTASLQCFVASSFVLSRPSLSNTAVNAASTSPGFENLRAIMGSSWGNFTDANSTGAVARPSFKSAAAGLPNWLDDALKSIENEMWLVLIENQ